eukprot:403350699
MIVENLNETRCFLIIKENIPQDIYIQLEDVQGLRKFDFYPKIFMDVEKPASISEGREFIWRVPLHMEQKFYSSHVINYEKRHNSEMGFGLHLQVHYPFHFRYQPVAQNQSFTNVSWENPQIYFDCKARDLSQYAKGGKRLRDLHNILTPKYPSRAVSALIPNGRIEERDDIVYTTLGLSIGAFLLLTKVLVSKSQEKVIPRQ